MAPDVTAGHIEIVEGARAPKARIRGSRVWVIDIVERYEGSGWSVEKIVTEFPELTKSKVFAALAYYWDHREEIEAKRAADDAFVEEYARLSASPLAETLSRGAEIPASPGIDRHFASVFAPSSDWRAEREAFQRGLAEEPDLERS
jgi:uncharacterized protein (DUF433 family)